MSGFEDLLSKLPKVDKPPSSVGRNARVPCPHCNCFESNVRTTHYRWHQPKGAGVRRGRICKQCKKPFSTLEVLEIGYTTLLNKARLFDYVVQAILSNSKLNKLLAKVIINEREES